jgi:mannose-6-phosphate isomerase-like protein (cupin superfamily)
VPIIEPGSWLNPENRPEWSAFTSAGRFAIPLEGGRFERHHHDEEELWFITEGKGRIVVDGEERYIQGGDIVLTERGDVHDIIAVYEPIRGFFTTSGLPEGGRSGHIDGVAHDVPALPLPVDFPSR